MAKLPFFIERGKTIRNGKKKKKENGQMVCMGVAPLSYFFGKMTLFIAQKREWQHWQEYNGK